MKGYIFIGLALFALLITIIAVIISDRRHKPSDRDKRSADIARDSYHDGHTFT